MVNNSKSLVWIALVGVIALAVVLGYRYLTTRKRAQIELTGGEQYRKLAEEYRRLADMAITAQEHTDLRLEDLRVQLESLRKALKGRIPVGVTLTGLQAGGCGTNRNASAVVLVSV